MSKDEDIFEKMRRERESDAVRNRINKANELQKTRRELMCGKERPSYQATPDDDNWDSKGWGPNSPGGSGCFTVFLVFVLLGFTPTILRAFF